MDAGFSTFVVHLTLGCTQKDLRKIQRFPSSAVKSVDIWTRRVLSGSVLRLNSQKEFSTYHPCYSHIIKHRGDGRKKEKIKRPCYLLTPAML